MIPCFYSRDLLADSICSLLAIATVKGRFLAIDKV